MGASKGTAMSSVLVNDPSRESHQAGPLHQCPSAVMLFCFLCSRILPILILNESALQYPHVHCLLQEAYPDSANELTWPTIYRETSAAIPLRTTDGVWTIIPNILGGGTSMNAGRG
jgi:hypothetical protein